MPEVLEEEPQLLEALRSGGGDGGVRSTELALASPNGGTASAAPGAARSCLARAASAAGTQLNKLLYLSEHLMAVLYTQLRHSLPAPTLGSASPDKGMLAYDANGGSSATENVRPSQQALGSERVSIPAAAALVWYGRRLAKVWFGRRRSSGGGWLAGWHTPQETGGMFQPAPTCRICCSCCMPSTDCWPPAPIALLQDLDQLRRLMEPVVAALESVTARLGTGAARRDVDSLQLLVRRTKEYLSLL